MIQRVGTMSLFNTLNFSVFKNVNVAAIDFWMDFNHLSFGYGGEAQ